MRRYFPSSNASLLPLVLSLLSSWVAQQRVGVSSMAIHPTNTNNHRKNFINSPHIGYINDPTHKHEIYVIGTSHFKCNSAAEVSSLITSVKPDGVILELDPERTLRLTKQYYGFDAASSSSSDDSDDAQYQRDGKNNKELLYGSDFVSAITTCQDMDIPLFWGDESVSETKNRLLQQLFSVEAYSPRYLMNALMLPMIFATTNTTSSATAAEKSESTTVAATEESRKTTTSTTIMSRINLLASFKADPKKLTPLAISSSPPLLVSALTLLFHYSNNGASAGEEVSIASSNILIGTFTIIETILSIIISFLISCFLFNTVIVERDMILADSTTRALDTLRLLKDGLLIRKRWEFTVHNTSSRNDDKDDMDDEEANNSSSSNGKKSELPLFTLKTPLISGKIRNLNLFEPRWLRMIDSVASSSSTIVSQQPQFGCVKCTNKFYSATSISNNNNDSFIEGRYADIIFERKVTLASIVNLKEGKRPVSGDRKIGVTIQGGDEFSICDESSISVTEDGYMVATDVRVTKGGSIDDEKSLPTQLRGEGECSDDWVRVVVVVGLLHGNGVLELLSKKSVASPKV
jgi:hypothetical protein